MKKSITIFVLGLSLSGASAQTTKQAISIDCTNDDDWIGKRLCTELRDEIASSPRYRETEQRADEFHWNLHIVSMRDGAAASAQAVTLTMGRKTDESFIQSWVQVTGSERVKSQAETIFAAIDGVVQGIEH
jgi:hypothetical protein